LEICGGGGRVGEARRADAGPKKLGSLRVSDSEGLGGFENFERDAMVEPRVGRREVR